MSRRIRPVKDGSLALLRERLVDNYRKVSRVNAKRELKMLTTNDKEEVLESHGYLRGLRRAIDLVEITMNDNQFPFPAGY